MRRKEQKKRENQRLARARLLFQKDLAWVSGFPAQMVNREHSGDSERTSPSNPDTEVHWIRLDRIFDGQSIFTVDRDVLRQSELAASKLRHRYPKAIFKLFADPEVWFSRFDFLLSQLKEVIHGDQTASGMVQSLLSDPNLLGDLSNWHTSIDREFKLLNAVRFAEQFRTKPADAELAGWLDFAAAPLGALQRSSWAPAENPDLGLCESDFELLLLILLRNGLPTSECVQSVCRLLSSSAVRFIHYPNPNEFILFETNRVRELIRSPNRDNTESKSLRAVGPRKTIRQLAIEHLRFTGSLKPKDRIARLSLLAQLGQPHVIDALERVGNDAYAEERRLRGLRQQFEQLAAATKIRSKKMAKPLLAEANARVLPDAQVKLVSNVAKLIQRASTESMSAALVQEYSSWLESTHDQFSTGAGVAIDLLKRVECASEKDAHSVGRMIRLQNQLHHIFSELARLARASNANRAVVKMFDPLLAENVHGCRINLFDPWLDDTKLGWQTRQRRKASPKDLNRLFELVGYLARTGRLPRKHQVVDSLPAIAIYLDDVEQGAELTMQLENGECEWFVDVTDLNAVAPFVDDSVGLADLLLPVLNASFSTESLTQLAPLGETPTARALVQKWILNENETAATYFGNLLIGLQQADQCIALVPRQTNSRDWIGRYPTSLHKNLHLLCESCGNAEVVAKKVLRQDFFDDSKRIAELEYLQSELDAEVLDPQKAAKWRARCEKIERWLQHPPNVSPRRLTRLDQKLHERALLEFQRWLDDSLTSQLIALAPPHQRPSDLQRLHEPIYRNLLSGIPTLKEPERTFAWELLRLSLNGKVFPELRHAENRSFLAKVEAVGIVTIPWMDLTRTVRCELTSGRFVEVGFSHDPLDYLLMGHHFGTCLSPDSFNFFSTVANAIDVNKRVLYGRDQQGKLIGRCLVALNAKGEVLRFRSYAHDDLQKFDAAVETFLNALVVDMRTQRRYSGNIPRIVASDWYDDGVVGPGNKSELPSFQMLQRLLEKIVTTSESSDLVRSRFEELLAACLQEQPIDQIVHWMPWSYGIYQAPFPYPNWVLEVLINIAQTHASVDAMLGIAAKSVKLNQQAITDRALSGVGVKEWLRRFKQSVCGTRNCVRFHGIEDPQLVGAILNHLDPTSGLRLMRVSRKRWIHSDREETDETRRALLADLHQRLGRQRLAGELRSQPQNTAK